MILTDSITLCDRCYRIGEKIPSNKYIAVTLWEIADKAAYQLFKLMGFDNPLNIRLITDTFFQFIEDSSELCIL